MNSGFLHGFAFGVAATAHCIGMCGGFPLHLSRATQGASVAWRQLLYLAGKTFTYAFLGVLFAALGNTLVASGLLPNSQKAMAILAGAVILLFGLGMLGVKLPSPVSGRLNAYEWGFVKSIYSHFFAHPGHGSSFLLGMATGFLPCPMTLAMLAVAAASASVPQGVAVMAGLGLGTAPGLLAVGLGGGLITARWKRIGLRPAGAIVIILGLVTILRTQEFMHAGCHGAAAGSKTTAPACGCLECQRLGYPCPRCAAAKAPAAETKPEDAGQ